MAAWEEGGRGRLGEPGAGEGRARPSSPGAGGGLRDGAGLGTSSPAGFTGAAGGGADGTGAGWTETAATGAVSGVPSAARFTSLRRRASGSTARYPSSRSSIENPLIGPASPRAVRAAWSAFCQESASTTTDCASALSIDVTSTCQRIWKESSMPAETAGRRAQCSRAPHLARRRRPGASRSPRRGTLNELRDDARAAGTCIIAHRPQPVRRPQTRCVERRENCRDEANHERDRPRNNELVGPDLDRQIRDKIDLRVERELVRLERLAAGVAEQEAERRPIAPMNPPW